jgi:hypothetical protein
MWMMEPLLREHPIVFAILVLGLAYLIRVAYAMRQGATWVLQAFGVAFIVMLIGKAIAQSKGVGPQNAEYIGVAAAAMAFGLFPKRSRYIPSRVKKEVISRHVKKTGRYDPKEEHIDHIVPFSKGGSHTVDNLRVIPKKKNLNKGKRMPSPTDWL